MNRQDVINRFNHNDANKNLVNSVIASFRDNASGFQINTMFLLNFAYPFLGIAALLDRLYISRSSAVYPTLLCWIVYTSHGLLLFILLCFAGSSIHLTVFCCLSYSALLDRLSHGLLLFILLCFAGSSISRSSAVYPTLQTFASTQIYMND